MKIKFKTDYRDFGETAYLIWKKNNQSSNYSSILILHLSIAAISSIPIFLFAPHFIFAVLNFFIILCLCIYFYRPTTESYFRNFYRSVYKNESYETEIELLDEGVKISQRGMKALFDWQNIIEIVEAENKLYLLFKFQNGILIPKSAFETPSETGNFIAYTKAHIQTLNAHQLNG